MEKDALGENEGTDGNNDSAIFGRQGARSKSFSDMPATDAMRKAKSFDELSEIMEVRAPLSRRSKSVDFLDSVCMNEEVEQLEDQIDLLHSTLQSKDDTISAFHQENLFLSDNDFHAQINYLKIECARKGKEIERLTSIERSFKQTKQVLKDTTWTLKIKEERLKNIKTEMRENYEKRLNELITRLNEREFRITSLHNENLLLQESERNHLIRVEELSHQVNLLLDEKNLHNKQKENEQTSVPKEHKMMQVSDTDFKDNHYYDTILKENDDLKEQLKEKEETVFFLRDSYTQEVNSLQNEVTKSKSHIIELQQMLEGVSTNSDNLPTNQVVQSAVTPLDRYLLDTCTVNQDNDSVDGLDELNSLTEEISIKNDELSEGKSSSTKQVNHTIDQYEKQIKDLQTLYDQDVDALEKEKEEMHAQVEEMKKKLLNNSLSTHKINEMREEYENQIMELKSLHKEQENQLIQTVSEEIKNLHVENESLKTLLDRLDKQHKDDLVTCRDQLEESFRDEVQYHMHNMIDQQKDHIKAAQEQLHTDLKDLQIHHDSLYKDVGSKFKTDNRQLEIELDETHANELMALHEEKSNLQNKVSSLKEQLNMLQDNNDNLNKCIDDLKREKDAKSLDIDGTEFHVCVQEMNKSILDIQTCIAPVGDDEVVSNEMDEEVFAIENCNLHEDIQLLRAKLDETKRDVQNLVNERDNFSVLSNTLNVELNTLKSDLEKNQKLELDHFQEALNKLNEEHLLEVNQLESEIQSKENKLQSLENQLQTELNDMFVVSEERLIVSNSRNLSELRTNLDNDYKERLALLEEQMLGQHELEIEENKKKFAVETNKLKNGILSSFKNTLSQTYVNILKRIPSKVTTDVFNSVQLIPAVDQEIHLEDIQHEINSLEKLDSDKLCDVFLKKFDCLLMNVQAKQSNKYEEHLNEKLQEANEKHQHEMNKLQLELNNLQVVVKEKENEMESSLQSQEIRLNDILSNKIKELNDEQEQSLSDMKSKFAEEMIGFKKKHANQIKDLVLKHNEELDTNNSANQEQVTKLEAEIEYYKENEESVEELNNEIAALEKLLQDLNAKLIEATSNRIQLNVLKSKVHSLKTLHSTETCNLEQHLGEFAHLLGKSKQVVIETINDFQMNVLETKESNLDTISKLYSSLVLEKSLYELKVEHLVEWLQHVFRESFECQQLLYSNMEDEFGKKIKELFFKLSSLEENIKLWVNQKPQHSSLDNVADEYVILDLNNDSLKKGFSVQQHKDLLDNRSVECQTEVEESVRTADQFVQTKSDAVVSLQSGVDNMKMELMKQHEMLIEEFAQEQEKEIQSLEKDHKERIMQLNAGFLDSVSLFKKKILMYLDDEHKLDEENNQKVTSLPCEKEFEELFQAICTKKDTMLDVQIVERKEKGISVNLDSSHQQQIDILQKDNSKLFMCLENLLGQLNQSENTIQYKLDYFINKYEPTALSKQNDHKLESAVSPTVTNNSSPDIQPDSLEQIADVGLRMETVLEKMLQLIDLANDQLDDNYAVYESLFTEHNELLDTVKMLNGEKETLSKDLDTVAMTCSELENRLEEVIEHNINTEHKYEEVLLENDKLKESINSKIQDLLSMEENFSTLQNQYNDLKESFGELQQKYANEESRNATLLESIEKQFKEVSSNLTESKGNCEAMEIRIADLQQHLNMECEKNVELQKKINDLEQDYNSLREEYNDYQNNQKEILEKEGVIEQKYGEALSENIRLQELCNAKVHDLTSMEDNYSTLQEQYDVLKESHETLEKSLASETNINAKLHQSLDLQTRHVKEITYDLEESLANCEVLKNKFGESQQNLDNECEMNNELQKQLNDKSNEVDNLENELNSLKTKYATLQKNEKGVIEREGDMELKYKKLLHENSKLRDGIKTKTQDLSCMEETVFALKHQNDELEDSCNSLEQSLSNEQSARSELLQSFENQTREVENINYKLTDSLAKCKALKDEIANLHRHLNNERQHLNNERKNNTKLQQKVNDTSRELSSQLQDLAHTKQLCHDLKKECATHEKSLLQANIEIKKLNEGVKGLSHDIETDLINRQYVNTEKHNSPMKNFDINAVDSSVNESYCGRNMLIKDTISVATLFDLLSLIDESIAKCQSDNLMGMEEFQKDLKQSLANLITTKCCSLPRDTSSHDMMVTLMRDDVANPIEITSRVLDTVNTLLEHSRLQVTRLEEKEDLLKSSREVQEDHQFISTEMPKQEKKLNATIETLLKDIQEEADNVLDLVLNQSSEEFIDADLVRSMQERWKQEKRDLLDNIQALENLLKESDATAENCVMELRNEQKQLENELRSEKIRNRDVVNVLNDFESKAVSTVSKLEDETRQNKVLHDECLELRKTVRSLEESLNTEKLLKNHERKQFDDERAKCKTLTDTLKTRTKQLQKIKELFGEEELVFKDGSEDEHMLSDIESLIKEELKKQAVLTERLRTEMAQSKFLNEMVIKQKSQLESISTKSKDGRDDSEKQEKLRHLLSSERKKQQSLQAIMERSELEMQDKINELQSINEQLQDDVDELLSHSLDPDGNWSHERSKEQEFDDDSGKKLIGAGWTIAKVQRLYLKYFRAESFRRALSYQKRYLCLLLKRLQPKNERPLGESSKPSRFKSVCFAVIAINRMRYLVRKYQRNLHKSSANYKFNKCNNHTKSSRSPDMKPIKSLDINPTEFQEIKEFQFAETFDEPIKSRGNDSMKFYEMKPYKYSKIKPIGSKGINTMAGMNSSEDSETDVTLTLFQHAKEKSLGSYNGHLDAQLKHRQQFRTRPVSKETSFLLTHTLASRSFRKSDINDSLTSPPSSYPRSTNHSYQSRDPLFSMLDDNPVSSLNSYIKKLESLQQRLKNS